MHLNQIGSYLCLQKQGFAIIIDLLPATDSKPAELIYETASNTFPSCVSVRFFHTILRCPGESIQA